MSLAGRTVTGEIASSPPQARAGTATNIRGRATSETRSCGASRLQEIRGFERVGWGVHGEIRKGSHGPRFFLSRAVFAAPVGPNYFASVSVSISLPSWRRETHCPATSHRIVTMACTRACSRV